MTDDPKKALDEAIERGNAYAEAGGDCIFYLFCTPVISAAQTS